MLAWRLAHQFNNPFAAINDFEAEFLIERQSGRVVEGACFEQQALRTMRPGKINDIGQEISPQSGADPIWRQAKKFQLMEVFCSGVDFRNTARRAVNIKDINVYRWIMNDLDKIIIAHAPPANPVIRIANQTIEIAIKMYRRFFGPQQGDFLGGRGGVGRTGRSV